MKYEPEVSDAPAGNQTARQLGRTQSVSLHDQLYRYAEDLQQMIERNGALESHCELLRESSVRLQESREVLDDLMRYTSDIHIVTDAAGTIVQSNPAVAVMAPQLRLAGDKLLNWVMPAHRDRFLSLQAGVIKGRELPEKDLEIHLRREADPAVPLIVAAQVVAVRRAEEVIYLHWILRDVTHLRETEFESRVSSMVFNSATEGVIITDIEGVIIAVNPAFSRITGYSAEEALGRNPRFLNSGLQDAAFYTDFWRALRDNGNWQGEIYNRKKNGEVYPEWLTVNAARGPEGQILTYIAVFTDLSRLFREEKRLAYLAHHDTLTNLPNRLLLQDRLKQTLSQARRFAQAFSLIFIDLDRFKAINDTHGHQAGDQVLQEAGRRLAAAVREVDTVARLGGDEFVILAPGLVGNADIDGFCTKILEVLTEPISLQSASVSIGGSLGCVEYPHYGEDEASLLHLADLAMYRAKAAGGNTYAIYGSTDDEGNLQSSSGH
jgi:diguanylate cyclase (GGDEF)-like protein/PAS domain S-box-containing protein